MSEGKDTEAIVRLSLVGVLDSAPEARRADGAAASWCAGRPLGELVEAVTGEISAWRELG